MARIIMLVPAIINAGTKTLSFGLVDALKKKDVRAALLPDFDLDIIEKLLTIKNREDLLEEVLQQCEIASLGKDLVVINGLSLTKPYAAELNFSIATALDASVVFVFAEQNNLVEDIRQLKIIAKPYYDRACHKVLGVFGNKLDGSEVHCLEEKISNFNFKIKLLETIPYRHEFIERHSETYSGAAIGKYLNLGWIWPFLNNVIEPVLTPTMFRHLVFNRAQEANKKIVLPEGDELRTLRAANICASRGIAQCVLLGERRAIYDICSKNQITLSEQIEIIEPQIIREKYIDQLCEARRGKGVTAQMALEQLSDNTTLGTMMLHLGEVDGLVSGALNSTANTIRPALQIIKTAPGVKLVSSVFFMCLPDQVLVYGDCAINPNPDPEELADIAIQSAKSAAAFGITPRVAMLSYSTGDSGAGPDVEKVKAATEIAKLREPYLEIDGPLQYDAAIDRTVAELKAPGSKVAGRATVFIVPDLNVGNVAYKAVQRSTGIVCVGPMLQGLRKPVNDLSRGCSVDDIVFTIAITAIQAKFDNAGS